MPLFSLYVYAYAHVYVCVMCVYMRCVCVAYAIARVMRMRCVCVGARALNEKLTRGRGMKTVAFICDSTLLYILATRG